MDQNYLVFGIGSGEYRDGFCIYHKLDFNQIDKFIRWIEIVKPDEIYNLAAQSDAMMSLENPGLTLFTNANTVMALCDYVHKTQNPIKIFQANSVEIFKGLITDTILDETNLSFYPKNPYAIGKLSAYWTIRYYRETYKYHMSNGIIFNAESPRRASRYVTQKISRWIKHGVYHEVLEIGDLNVHCDWIHASDVALGAYIMLQQPEGDDYVINLSMVHTVREFIMIALQSIKIRITWVGTGLQEIGIDDNGTLLVRVNPCYFRPYETPIQRWSNAKLLSIGWVPKYNLETLIDDLIGINIMR